MPVDIRPETLVTNPEVVRLVEGYKEATPAPEGATVYTFKPHTDNRGRIDPYGQEDLVPQHKVYALLQAGNSEDPQNPTNFDGNESHRAVLVCITPTAPDSVSIQYAYKTFDQKVSILDPQAVVEAFSADPNVVYDFCSGINPQEVGSRTIFSEFPPSLGMIRKGIIQPQTAETVRGKTVQFLNDINLGLPPDTQKRVFGNGDDDMVLEVRQASLK